MKTTSNGHKVPAGTAYRSTEKEFHDVLAELLLLSRAARAAVRAYGKRDKLSTLTALDRVNLGISNAVVRDQELFDGFLVAARRRHEERRKK